MKTIFFILTFLLLYSCSSSRIPAQISSPDEVLTSAAGGNIKVVAKRYYQNDQFCFDLKMSFKGISEKEARWSNWDLHYFDDKGIATLSSISDRAPASSTKGGAIVGPQYFHEEYESHTQSCLPSKNVNSIQLTPKKLHYSIKPLVLKWNS